MLFLQFGPSENLNNFFYPLKNSKVKGAGQVFEITARPTIKYDLKAVESNFQNGEKNRLVSHVYNRREQL